MFSILSRVLNRTTSWRLTRDESSEKKKDNRPKWFLEIAIIGHKNTGKSSLLKRLTNRDFDFRYVPTAWTDDIRMKIPIRPKGIELICEIFAEANVLEVVIDKEYGFFSSVIRKTPVIIFTYDCQEVESFSKMIDIINEHEKLDLWTYSLNIIFAMKSDNNVRPFVRYEEVENFARDKHMSFYRVSSIDSTYKELIDMFTDIATRVIEIWDHERGEDKWEEYQDPPYLVYQNLS